MASIEQQHSGSKIAGKLPASLETALASNLTFLIAGLLLLLSLLAPHWPVQPMASVLALLGGGSILARGRLLQSLGHGQLRLSGGATQRFTALCVAVLGAVYGVAAFSLLDFSDPGTALWTGLVIIAMATAVILAHPVNSLAQAAFLVPVGVGFAGHMAMDTATLPPAAGAAFLLVLGCLSTLAVALNRATRGMVRHRFTLRRMERQLQAAIDGTSAADRAKMEFLASMSHEFRTPLNAIIGFADAIRSQSVGPIGTRVYAQYAQHIHDSGQHLLTVVSEVLETARLDSGSFQLRESWFDLDDALEEVLTVARTNAAARDLSIERHPPLIGLELWGDRRLVIQSLLNLMGNSTKFTADGGRIVIRTADTADGLVITVEDTGIGIAHHEMEAIFEPFRKGNQALEILGTGLGLHLVKRWTEAHGGTVRVDSEPGRGTAISLSYTADRLRAHSQARLALPQVE